VKDQADVKGEATRRRPVLRSATMWIVAVWNMALGSPPARVASKTWSRLDALIRPENLRAIPEGSDDFKRLHVLRPDAESISRGVDDSFFLRRAPGKGWRRVLVELLGHARVVNSVTLARCRARAPARAAA
jgi:hypothetical protein